jgi:hypothetical protein
MKNQIHTEKMIGNFPLSSFDYEEFGIKGVGRGRVPIINMDRYIDHSLDEELHSECCKGLALSDEYHMGMMYGSLPPEEVARFGNKNSWSEIIKDLEKNDPTGKHARIIDEIMKDDSIKDKMSVIYKYAYYALGAAIPWFYTLYLKSNSFKKKSENIGVWTKSSLRFPTVIKYLETLPFKHIGRALFFTTYPNAGVLIHRDSVVEEHQNHNINLFFSAGGRPSFLWDERTKEKIYLEKGARSYFFNNRDYHGVDPEPVFRYTLRVDGTFTDELCEKLGLEDGYTWKWDYEK